MEVHDFHKDFLEEVKSTAATEGAGSNAAFVSVTTQYLINSEVLTDFNPSFYMGTGRNNRKLRVDGYVLDEFDLTLNLIISDYTGEEDRDTLTKKQAETQFERISYFLDEVYQRGLRRNVEPSTPVYDLIELLLSNQKRIRKFSPNYSRISGIAYENGYVRENSSKTDTLQSFPPNKGALLPWGSDNF